LFLLRKNKGRSLFFSPAFWKPGHIRGQCRYAAILAAAEANFLAKLKN
jgi:hypothetical protein